MFLTGDSGASRGRTLFDCAAGLGFPVSGLSAVEGGGCRGYKSAINLESNGRERETLDHGLETQCPAGCEVSIPRNTSPSRGCCH